MSLSKKIPRSMSRSRTIPYKEINITCHYRELHSPQRPNISIRKESNCPVLPHSLFQIESVNCGYGSIPILIRSSWLNSIHFDFSRVRLNWCRLTRSSSPSYSVIQNGQERYVSINLFIYLDLLWQRKLSSFLFGEIPRIYLRTGMTDPFSA